MNQKPHCTFTVHYNDFIMSAMASQITSLTIVYSTIYSFADQRKHQSSASLAFVRRIHRWPVNSPHKGPVTRKCFHLMTSSCISKLSAWYPALFYQSIPRNQQKTSFHGSEGIFQNGRRDLERYSRASRAKVRSELYQHHTDLAPWQRATRWN